MKKKDRIEKIMEMLRRENGLPIQVLSTQLGVSHMTVRRDLEEMAYNNLVRQIHGGVVLGPCGQTERVEGPYSLRAAGSQHAAEKARIGIKASELIDDNDTLIIDSGSTTELLAANLPRDKNLTILSYSLNIIGETAGLENVRSVIAGGNLHQNTLMFESQEGITLIRRYRATKTFISAAGITSDFGVTCLNAYERETKKAAIESSFRRILLADASKFGIIRSEYFADLADFDLVVSDSSLGDEHRKTLENLGIELILV